MKSSPMMADDSSKIALQPALTSSQLKYALKRSKDLNSEIWGKPSELGSESSAFRSAEKHWLRLLSFQIPVPNEDKATFAEATRLAWWACWRARDYTVPGIHRRLNKMNLSSNEIHVWLNSASDRVKICGGEWPISHIPLGFLEEDQLSEAQRQISHLHKRRFTQDVRALLDRFAEGAIINNFRDPERRLSWQESYTANWCVFDESGPDVHSPENCYFTDQAGAPQATIVGSATQTLSECPIEIKGFTETSKLRSCRFSNGLLMRSGRFRESFDFPDSIETGIGLTFVSSTIQRSLNFKAHSGIRSLNFIGTGGGTIQIADQTLVSLTLNSMPSESRLALCSIRKAEIALLTVQGSRLETLCLEQSILKECLEAQNSTIQSITFDRVRFLDSARGLNGRESSIERTLKISDCEFAGEVDLTDARIGTLVANTDSEVSKNQFHRAFIARSTRDDTKPSIGHVDVRNSEFWDEVTFENREFRERTAFEDCLFHRAPRFQSCTFNFDTSFRRTKFDWKPFVLAESGRKRDDRLSVTEGSFRTLAKHMETIKANDYQSKFHTEQLKARFMRTDEGEVSKSEKFFASGYSFLSSYGSNFVRPVLLLGALWFVTAALYFLIAICTGLTGSTQLVANSGILGLTLTFRPFFVFNPLFGREGLDTCGLEEGLCGSVQLAAHLTQSYELGFKLVGTVHSLLSTLLIFLFLLALRRKFQLS